MCACNAQELRASHSQNVRVTPQLFGAIQNGWVNSHVDTLRSLAGGVRRAENFPQQSQMMKPSDVLLMIFGLWFMSLVTNIEPDEKGSAIGALVILTIGGAIVWWAGWGPSLHWTWSIGS